jgi:hypothetical protein
MAVLPGLMHFAQHNLDFRDPLRDPTREGQPRRQGPLTTALSKASTSVHRSPLIVR